MIVEFSVNVMIGSLEFGWSKEFSLADDIFISIFREMISESSNNGGLRMARRHSVRETDKDAPQRRCLLVSDAVEFVRQEFGRRSDIKVRARPVSQTRAAQGRLESVRGDSSELFQVIAYTLDELLVQRAR